MTDFSQLTIKKFGDGLRRKDFSAREVAENYLQAIQDGDAQIGAYLSLDQEGALRDAEVVDHALSAGEQLGNMAGVALAIKDAILVKGQPATAASQILKDYTAAYDATVISKLRAARAVFLGKANMDEFAMGSSTENSSFQKTRNPRDPERVPGGSSGGSATRPDSRPAKPPACRATTTA